MVTITSVVVLLSCYVGCYSTLVREHNPDLPKYFEVRNNPLKTFNQNINHIEELARDRGLNVVYQVKIDTKTIGPQTKKPELRRFGRFNAPLKKKILKLTAYEKMIRKLMEEKNRAVSTMQSTQTTEMEMMIPTMRPQKLKKYKPNVNKMKRFGKKINFSTNKPMRKYSRFMS